MKKNRRLNMFTKAIVRKPGRSLISGITTAEGLGKPDYEKAVLQHEAYVGALESCGVEVEVLEQSEEFPDSCFVEDVAVLFDEAAVITNPGAPARNAEKEMIIGTIKKYYEKIERIEKPGTLEGGDIMQDGKIFYIGVSERTNREGAMQLKSIVEKYGYQARLVPVCEVLHLKTGVTLFPDGFLLAGASFGNDTAFDGSVRHFVPEEEAYAANCLLVNGKAIVPSGFPKTLEVLKNRGYEIIETDMSEFRKIDGGLTCLSLRF